MKQITIVNFTTSMFYTHICWKCLLYTINQAWRNFDACITGYQDPNPDAIIARYDCWNYYVRLVPNPSTHTG